MEIRITGGKTTEPTTIEATKLATVPTTAKLGFKAGMVKQASAKDMIPPFIADKISHACKEYGIMDFGKMSLSDATPDNLKATRKIVDLMKSNSKLLPDFFKLLKQLLDADIDLAKFHKNVTKAALEHQTSIDRETAEIFIAMAQSQARTGKLEQRVNTRNQLIEQRAEAYEQLYENSVYGNESRVIDVEFQIAASNNKILTESKTKRAEFKSDRKKALKAYIDGAYAE